MMCVFYSTVSEVAVHIPLLEGAGGGLLAMYRPEKFYFFDLILQ
jgi:hypothetical protein